MATKIIRPPNKKILFAKMKEAIGLRVLPCRSPMSLAELRGMKKFANLAGWDGTGRDGIVLIHYSVPRILVKRNRLKILWVDRILTTSKH